MSAILKIVLEAEHSRLAARLPALHGNVQDNSHLHQLLAQLVSLAGAPAPLDEDVEELLLWSRVPFESMSRIVHALEISGWYVMRQHGNHVRLHRRT